VKRVLPYVVAWRVVCLAGIAGLLSCLRLPDGQQGPDSPMYATAAALPAPRPFHALPPSVKNRLTWSDTPPLVAPLRTDPVLSPRDDGFRTTPPLIPRGTFPAIPTLSSFVLSNGLRIAVLPRSGSRTVAATLTLDLSQTNADDVGGRRASLLGPVFFPPTDAMGALTGSCTVVVCQVSARGISADLSAILKSVAATVVPPWTPSPEDQTRLGRALRALAQWGDPLDNNSRAALFGPNSAYGFPKATPSPTLAELLAFRQTSFEPAGATLAVVGDVAVEVVRAVVQDSFGAWMPRSARRATLTKSPSAVAVPPNPVVFCPLDAAGIQFGVALKGPAPAGRDAAAFAVFAEILGGGIDSATFHSVREEEAFAYTLDAKITSFPDVSMMLVRTVFGAAEVRAGTRALLAQIEVLRNSALDTDVLERAKGAAEGHWRTEWTSNLEIARSLSSAYVMLSTPDAELRWPVRLRAVTKSDLRAVANTYAADAKLRFVLVGSEKVVGNAEFLDRGRPAQSDYYGHIVSGPP
jgi:predicted Zn-dependent peptidase